jgi:hypothetical protein
VRPTKAITELQWVLVLGKLAAPVFRGQFIIPGVEVMKLRTILQFSPALLATLTHQRVSNRTAVTCDRIK